MPSKTLFFFPVHLWEKILLLFTLHWHLSHPIMICDLWRQFILFADVPTRFKNSDSRDSLSWHFKSEWKPSILQNSFSIQSLRQPAISMTSCSLQENSDWQGEEKPTLHQWQGQESSRFLRHRFSFHELSPASVWIDRPWNIDHTEAAAIPTTESRAQSPWNTFTTRKPELDQLRSQFRSPAFILFHPRDVLGQLWMHNSTFPSFDTP